MAAFLRSLFPRLPFATSAVASRPATTSVKAPAMAMTWAATTNSAAAAPLPQTRPLHTTSPLSRGQPGGKEKMKGNKRKKKENLPDPRIKNIRLSTSQRVPAPLRFARSRYMRHWTIHRAWLLYQRQVREAKDRELERYVGAFPCLCLAGGHLLGVFCGARALFSFSFHPTLRR